MSLGRGWWGVDGIIIMTVMKLDTQPFGWCLLSFFLKKRETAHYVFFAVPLRGACSMRSESPAEEKTRLIHAWSHVVEPASDATCADLLGLGGEQRAIECAWFPAAFTWLQLSVPDTLRLFVNRHFTGLGPHASLGFALFQINFRQPCFHYFSTRCGIE